MTYKLFTCDTNKIIHHSSLRSAEDPSTINVRAAPADGESIKQHIISKHDTLQETSTVPDEHKPDLPIDVTLRSVATPQEKEENLQAIIIETVTGPGRSSTNKEEHSEFRLVYKKSDMEEILTYQQIMEYLEEDERNQGVWKFNRISGYQGPLKQCGPDYTGSSFNVTIEWENGEVTTKPLNIIAEDDPVTCAIMHSIMAC
ncbi:hypothetical protein IV203_006543 [Nitzschia inconspicua]|uniref:Uncharacterized protein n=1 Tax=Nitzschia inconspicua TaxID=303405 RepID=A0A9K3PCM2_9STRA|nr:hypothetical protein IV203_006543 [Nitzschia inconspicua]